MLCLSNKIIVLELVLKGFNIRQVHKEYGNTTYKNQMIRMKPENVSKYAIDGMTRGSNQHLVQVLHARVDASMIRPKTKKKAPAG